MKELEKLFIFNGLEECQKNEIVSSFSKPKIYKKNEIIYSATHFPNALGYILNGEAFAVTDNGQNVVMRSFQRGCCFGAASIFGGDDKYVSTITAKTDIEILFISQSELESIFLKYPKTALNYINFLSEKIRFLNTKLNVISCSNAEDTLLKYLVSVCDSQNNAIIPKSMTLLAKSLGLGRATLYRCLDSLEKDGIILRENNTIKVIKNEKNS